MMVCEYNPFETGIIILNTANIEKKVKITL